MILTVCRGCRVILHDPEVVTTSDRFGRTRIHCPVCRTLREYDDMVVQLAQDEA